MSPSITVSGTRSRAAAAAVQRKTTTVLSRDA
ncbi:hypothetical protein FHU39_001561 [Flexivirga oryzae]|uniref:Uncharacterized protein n=1 Tax=Flexivirga oryzae TaxID=1794944 RepID=A0A839N2M2_9MICO|nr:hypothetical protein [Flexivirga oryzae]